MSNNSNFISKQIFIWVIGMLLTISIAVIGGIYRINNVEDEYQQGVIENVKTQINDVKIRINILEVELKVLKAGYKDNSHEVKASLERIRKHIEAIKDKVHLLEVKVQRCGE